MKSKKDLYNKIMSEVAKVVKKRINEAYDIKSINEVKYDFNKIDYRTGLPAIKKDPMDKVHLMTSIPAKSGYIYMLQNRVNFNSVGNRRSMVKVWYDRQTKTVSSNRNMEDAVSIREFKLNTGAKPAGWFYEEDVPVNFRLR